MADKGVVMRSRAVVRMRRSVATWIAIIAVTISSIVPALPARAQSNEEAAFFYLTDTLGFNVAAACGIMANIRHESNFHPGSMGGGGSYGICQWLGGRRSAMEYYCYDHGFSDDSLYGQLSFRTHELRTRYPGTYNYLMNVENSSDGAYNAAYEFCYNYERPGDRRGQSNSRGRLAAGTYWYRYQIYAYDMWLDTDKGRVYHYTDGTVHHGWLDLDGDRYYLDQDGILKYGLFSTEGNTYFADEEGILQYGWQEIAGNTYYFDEKTGAMHIGWTEVDGRMVFLDTNGKLTSVNSLNGKNEISEADIEEAISEKEAEAEKTVNAPCADPMPLPDNISGVVQNIQEAGSESQSNAAAVATPGQETEIDADDYASSDAVQGNTIDTTKLDVGDENEGVVMDESVPSESSETGITFEGAN